MRARLRVIVSSKISYELFMNGCRGSVVPNEKRAAEAAPLNKVRVAGGELSYSVPVFHVGVNFVLHHFEPTLCEVLVLDRILVRALTIT